MLVLKIIQMTVILTIFNDSPTTKTDRDGTEVIDTTVKNSGDWRLITLSHPEGSGVNVYRPIYIFSVLFKF